MSPTSKEPGTKAARRKPSKGEGKAKANPAAGAKPAPKKKPDPKKRPVKKPSAKKKPAPEKRPVKKSPAKKAKLSPEQELAPKKPVATEPERVSKEALPSSLRPVRRAGVPPAALWAAIAITETKVALRNWYQTAQVPSPMDGFLEPLRVRTNDNGSGTVIFECSASSLRFALAIPAATRGEKKKVKNVQEKGGDPHCPRHDPLQRLNRVGPYLVCPLCGVRYGMV